MREVRGAKAFDIEKLTDPSGSFTAKENGRDKAY